MDKKVALITGSSHGIGRATAIEFAKHGYNVIINYVKGEEDATDLKQKLEEKRSRIAFNYWLQRTETHKR